MRGAHLLTCLVLLVAGCDQRRPPEAAPTERTYDNPALGVSFLVPAAWVDDAEGAAVVVAGRPGTPDFFTTLTLQAGPVGAGDAADLERVLAASWAHVASDEPPYIVARVPTLAGGLPALRYLVAFDLHERPRLRAGLLLSHGASVIDLGYVAPRELFTQGLPVFERAVDTLTLAPPDGGEP